MTIITRADKGSALSHAELDNNFEELRDIPDGKVYPKTQGTGIKIDVATPDWGWIDVPGTLYLADTVQSASLNIFRGNMRAHQFEAEDEEAFIDFHMPHDYALGTNIYIHAHWSHNSTVVTGGSITWNFELMYAKGYDQAAYNAPVIIAVVGDCSVTQYQHLITEGVASISGGSATLLDLDDLEVDGIVLCRVSLDSNDITTSDASTVHPFINFVDLHVQSTGIPTKGRNIPFYI